MRKFPQGANERHSNVDAETNGRGSSAQHSDASASGSDSAPITALAFQMTELRSFPTGKAGLEPSAQLTDNNFLGCSVTQIRER